MAEAILQNRGLVNLGKKFIAQIRSPHSSISLRSVHASVYDKNPEEHEQPTVVPDHVLTPQPEQYWCPHPQTGVFGPATYHTLISSKNLVFQTGSNEDSVLEQKVFFRSHENLDRPIQH